jgi:hypothetical protein
MSHLPFLNCYSGIESEENEARTGNGCAPFPYMASTRAKRTTRGEVKPISSTRKKDALEVRERLAGKVLAQAEDIIEKVIEAAKTGNYLPTKFLFEFAGIMEPITKQDSEAEAQNRARSLAEVLLEAAQNGPKDPPQETPAA